MYNNQLRLFMNYYLQRYVVLNNGKIVKRNDISDEEYEAFKEWGYIIREYER